MEKRIRVGALNTKYYIYIKIKFGFSVFRFGFFTKPNRTEKSKFLRFQNRTEPKNRKNRTEFQISGLVRFGYSVFGFFAHP